MFVSVGLIVVSEAHLTKNYSRVSDSSYSAEKKCSSFLRAFFYLFLKLFRLILWTVRCRLIWVLTSLLGDSIYNWLNQRCWVSYMAFGRLWGLFSNIFLTISIAKNSIYGTFAADEIPDGRVEAHLLLHDDLSDVLQIAIKRMAAAE